MNAPRDTASRPPQPRTVPPLIVTPERRRIPVAGPAIRPADVDAVTHAAASAWHEHAGRCVRAFEDGFAARHGVAHAIATPSCTSALHLALTALGIGPGDEVVVPDLTWIATAAPVTYLGATPVFVDVVPGTWCIDPASVEAAIGERTRAILAVDLYGNLPDYAALRTLAERYGLALIEDAAQAIGSTRGGRPAGTFAEVGVFSFHGSKTLTTGEGGMLITDNGRIAERARALQDHGRSPGDHSFDCSEVGFKYRMTDMQAALGLSQLERLDELVDQKRALFARYREGLGDLPGIAWNAPGDDVRACPWMTTIVLRDRPAGARDALARHLAERGIDTRPMFPPLSSTGAFCKRTGARRARQRNRVAHELGPRGLNLPSSVDLSSDEVGRVIDAVREHLQTTAT